MQDKHDSVTLDWVGDVCDNVKTLSSSVEQNQTEVNQTNECVSDLRKETQMNLEMQTQLEDAVVPSIATSAKIVSLHRSVPDLTKNDTEAAEALARLKSADPSAIKTKKHLIDCAEHKALQKLSRAIYRYHMDNTLPWGDLGLRLLPNAKQIDYTNQMDVFFDEFYALKNSFLQVYPSHPAQAQVRLGDMFDESLYPSVYELDRKIKIRLEWDYMVDPQHFLVQVGDQASQESKSQYEDMLKRRMESAYTDVFKRLRGPLENMSKMLNYSGDDKPTGFQNTLVDNVTKFVELMRSCNVTGDATMTRITNELRLALNGVTPDALRNSESQRIQTKQDIDKIIEQMPTLDF